METPLFIIQGAANRNDDSLETTQGRQKDPKSGDFGYGYGYGYGRIISTTRIAGKDRVGCNAFFRRRAQPAVVAQTCGRLIMRQLNRQRPVDS